MGDSHPDKKGKGKDKEQPPPPPTQDGQSPSAIGNIVNSASGLASDLLRGQSGNASLAQSLSGDKGQPSSTDHAQQIGESSVRLQPRSRETATFRSGQSHAHIASEEAAFSSFLDGTEPLQPPDGETWQPQSGVPNVDSTATSIHHTSAAAQRDGQAVVALLTESEAFPLDDDAGEQALTPGAKDSLRRALFGNEPGNARQLQEWDNVLNFVPEFLQTDTRQSGMPETEAYLGVSDPDEARRVWISQWSDVLGRYTDEVWGDLGSLVEQARTEVEQLEKRPEDAPPETKALRRLRAILGHIRGR